MSQTIQTKALVAIETVIDYVKASDSITNRECRRLLNCSYDQAIFFLGKMSTSKILLRQGTAGSTHYVLPPNINEKNKKSVATQVIKKKIFI